MASAGGRDRGKSAFVGAVLTKDPQANPEAVNRAWTKAGHAGTISASLVNQIRSRMGLTSPPRPGARVPEGAESAEPPAAPAPRQRTGPKRGGGRSSAKENERPVPPVTASEAEPQEVGLQSGGDDRTRVLTRLEGQIDELLFAIKVAGGWPEFEEALRRTSRILARSHGE
ncbi:MAG: hypothetical protein JOZ53_07555 [Planctomycetaceae bacterium]|nr:hypothetical protein [Planctomycetaceae bacterium]